MQEPLEDLLLALHALLIHGSVVACGGLVNPLSDEAVGGGDLVVEEAPVVPLHARRQNRERRVRQGQQDHGADLAVRIAIGHASGSCWGHAGRRLQ